MLWRERPKCRLAEGADKSELMSISSRGQKLLRCDRDRRPISSGGKNYFAAIAIADQSVLGGKNYFAAIAIADQLVLGGKNCFAAIAIADQSVLGGKNYFAAIAIADQSVRGVKTTSLRSRSQTNQFGGQKLLRCERASSLSLRYY